MCQCNLDTLNMYQQTTQRPYKTIIWDQKCAHVPFFFSVFHSGGDPEHQLRGDGTQFSVSASPTSGVQALLRVPGQVFRVSLWGQLLRGLQGEKNLPECQTLDSALSACITSM